jgi:hypothetical protein
VIDGKGAVTFEGKVSAEPDALISLIRSKAPQPAGPVTAKLCEMAM